MHNEAYTYTRQTLNYPAPNIGKAAYRIHNAGGLGEDARIPGGLFQLGASKQQGFVFDNEKWQHPVEIALSMLLKIGLVYLLGPPAIGIVLFEIILNGTAMFNHANIRLPLVLDALVRKVLVTPDMHRVHHSVHRHEHDSNYGFSLSIWDRIFGTYIPQPEGGHDGMTTGLQWQDDRPSKLGWSLALPFTRK